MKKIKLLLLYLSILFSLSIPIYAANYKYTITYSANGGKQAPAKFTKSSTKSYLDTNLSKQKPTRKGYEFVNWNTNRKGNGKAYRPGAKVKLTKASKTLNLYAFWKKTETKREEKQDLEVHYLDIGQGDCTLIKSGNEAMLIDGGDGNQGTKIQSYLSSKGVSKLKYVIATHTDADHIGGLPVIITKFDIETFFMPKYAKDTRAYDNVMQALKYKNLKTTVPKQGSVYTLGTAKFTIVSTGKTYESANDTSICIRLVNGSNSFLFVGDAEESAEKDMMESGITLKSNVYKISHHGSRNGTTEKFIKAVNPSFAVISCGKDNSYGHPHASVLNLLRSRKVSVYRTDEQGTIIAKSDGTSITWNMSPSTSWIAGEATTNSQTKKTYVLNLSSKVFHLPTCSSVQKMSGKNKQEMESTYDDLVKKGYHACGNCLKNGG